MDDFSDFVRSHRDVERQGVPSRGADSVIVRQAKLRRPGQSGTAYNIILMKVDDRPYKLHYYQLSVNDGNIDMNDLLVALPEANAAFDKAVAEARSKGFVD
jgi:hypothetical protein